MLNVSLKRVAAAAVLALAAAGVVSPVLSQAQEAEVAAQTDSAVDIETGYTRPYEERKLAFGAPGLVDKVNVKVGEKVEAGAVIAQQDISVELAEKKPIEILATSPVQERYARADQGAKEKELQRKQQLYKTRNATELEVEEAKLNLERAKASVDLAIQERDENKARLAALDARIALKTLKTPIAGYVQAVEIGEGEIAASDPQSKPALVVVQNDPLKIDVHIPVPLVRSLAPGQTLQVRYIDDEGGRWREAKIRNLNPVVKKDAQTRQVELEMPNPENRPAGLEVEVRLPERIAADQQGRNTGGRGQAEAGR